MVTIHASMPPFGMRRRCTAPSLFKRAFDGIGSKSQVKQKEVGDESDCCDGPGCGNGRNETGGATRAAAIDQRSRRRGPCIGLRQHLTGLAFDLDGRSEE